MDVPSSFTPTCTPLLDPSRIRPTPSFLKLPLGVAIPKRDRGSVTVVHSGPCVTETKIETVGDEDGAISSKKDYYSVLGVPVWASLADIREAYRGLALRFHPDVVGPRPDDMATQRFAHINEAYTVLSNPCKRALYDREARPTSPSLVSVASELKAKPFTSKCTKSYTDASTGRVYSSINSCYKEWRRGRKEGV